MDWKKIAGALSADAPLLSSVLAASGVGAPAAAAVAIAGRVAASALGVDANPAAVDAALSADPQALAKVRQAELDNAVQLQQLAVTAAANQLAADTARLQADAQDRDSARKASVAGGTIKPLFWLSLLLLGLTIGSEIAVLFQGLPPGVPDIIIGRVLGLLDSVALMVLAFWYGTSSGSEQKTELLARADAVRG